MLRRILAAITGMLVYLAVGLIVMSLAYAVLGADRAFRPGTFMSSWTWLLVMGVVSILAGFLAGWVVAGMQGRRAVTILIVLVAFFGVLGLIDSDGGAVPTPRTEGVSYSQAMKNWDEPKWAAIADTIISVAGVWIGARRRNGATVA